MHVSHPRSGLHLDDGGQSWGFMSGRDRSRPGGPGRYLTATARYPAHIGAIPRPAAGGNIPVSAGPFPPARAPRPARLSRALSPEPQVFTFIHAWFLRSGLFALDRERLVGLSTVKTAVLGRLLLCRPSKALVVRMFQPGDLLISHFELCFLLQVGCACSN